MNILLVEDDQIIASGLIYALESEGYVPFHFANASSALESLEAQRYDLALLDLSLPDGHGFDICSTLKQQGDTPVIFLTAIDEEGHIVKGLEMGADDYITKPFRIRELLARIKTVLRRAAHSNEDLSPARVLGNIRIDTAQAKVYKQGEEMLLTALEYRLLLVFAANQGRVISRNQLLEDIWDVAGNFVNDNTLTVYVKRLRDKLEDDPQNPTLIQTVRGIGYKVGE